MEKKRSKPKKRVGGRICPDYRVSSDQLRFNQRRFHVSLTKTVSVILCDDTQTPLCHSETKEKKIPLFRQNKLHGLHSTTRWHRAPATALSFMRQLPHFCPPNSGVFKKRLSDADSKSEQKIVTFGFSVLSQFSLIVNRKMSQFGELRQKEKKKNIKWNTRLGMILFVCAGISMNSISGLSDSMGPKLWLSLALLLCGI